MSSGPAREGAPLPRAQGARGRRPAWLANSARAAVPLLLPLLLAGAVFLGLFFGLGAVPLFDVDEGAFGEATREMLERGDYVSTWLNGQARYDKPILIYWLQAASVHLLGLDEFALRLPSALASAAWIAAILAFARRFLDRGTAYAAAFIAAGSAGLTVIGRGAIADALLNLFLALSMFDIIRYAMNPRPAWRRRAFLWIGLGLLAKGPVALLVPGAASLLAFSLQGRAADWWRAVRDPAGWAILLAVALPWYLLEYERRGDAFLAGFFLRHNVERVLAPLQGHGGSPLYYLPAILVLLLPYTGLFLRTLTGLRRMNAAPLDTFLWCWFLFVLVFFSLAATKLPHYLLYGATPLFILMARQRHALRSNLLAFAPPLLFLGVVAALPRLLEYLAPTIRNPYVREALGQAGVFGPAWRAGALALLAAVLGLALWRGMSPWRRLAAAGLPCTLALVGLLLPALAELQQGPVKEAALLARRAGWDVHSWRINVPSFSVYRGAVTPAAPAAPQLASRGQVLLTRSDALAALGPVELLYRKGGIVLARMPR
ncbi:ArnT family glycosyltransferase [Massilia sp. LXY-6]|uniref:ArnT family glycosyltransferase n=1 Tax=Massilia sp. LXY-6 TaxID=3379823 RepID=UPI003EE020BF